MLADAAAQSWPRSRSASAAATSCIAQNKLCPGWIVDNFDRYTQPLVEHIVPDVLISVAIGFAIAFALALLARRRRWLVGPIVGFTGVLYTLPSLAVFFLLLPITGRGTTTAVIALTAYTLQIIFRNIVIGLDNVPGGGEGRRAAAWASPTGSCCGGWSCRSRCPTSSPACGSPRPARSGSRRWPCSRAPAGSGREIIAGSNITFKTGVVAAGGLARAARAGARRGPADGAARCSRRGGGRRPA